MEISNCGSFISKMPFGRAGQLLGAIENELNDCYPPARSMPRRRIARRKLVKASGRHIKRKATPMKAHRETGKRGKSVRRGRSRSRRSPLTTKKRCMRAGPLMNNGFLNFMREFRKKNCGLKPRESFSKGAQEWRSMNSECKAKYIKAGERVSRKKSRSHSAMCKK